MESFTKLIEIIKKLRAPDGCPWDRKQTHNSLLPSLYEESYEVADTILNEDKEHLKEELGDLLLQILLHSQIASEEKSFDINDVVTMLNEKLIRRHPHVFGNEKANSADEVTKIWAAVKNKEKQNKNKHSILSDIGKGFPPIKKAIKIQKNVSKVGFDWPDYKGAFAKIEEELAELKEAIADGSDVKNIEEEIGDLLFSIVNVSRFFKVDAEVALVKTNKKFINRFNYIEAKLKESNKDISTCSLEELDNLWNKAKIHDT